MCVCVTESYVSWLTTINELNVNLRFHKTNLVQCKKLIRSKKSFEREILGVWAIFVLAHEFISAFSESNYEMQK